MSISNTATKVEEFDFDPETANLAEVEEELATNNDQSEEIREEFDASTKSLDATQMYLSEIGFSPLLTAEEEVLYARRALRGDEAARKRMIESNLRLVVKISRRYSRPSVYQCRDARARQLQACRDTRLHHWQGHAIHPVQHCNHRQ